MTAPVVTIQSDFIFRALGFHGPHDPFWMVMANSERPCDFILDFWATGSNDEYSVALTFKDPAAPLREIRLQAWARDLRGLAQWILSRLQTKGLETPENLRASALALEATAARYRKWADDMEKAATAKTASADAVKKKG